MKVIHKMIITSVCVIIIGSCQDKMSNNSILDSIKTINVNPTQNKVVNRSSIYEIENIVKLDNDTTHLIDEIRNVYLFKRFFIVVSSRRLSLYNYAGHYLHDIGNIGRGPGEYLSVKSICFENNKFIILDRTQRKLIYYTLDNQYINEHSIDLYGQAMSTYKDEYVIYQGVEQNKYNKKLFFYDKDFNILYKYFDIDDITRRYMNAYEKTNFYFIHDTLCFLTGFYDTIYNININNNVHSITPRYSINFGKYSLPKSYYKQNFSDVQQYFTTLRKNDYAFYLMGFFETDELIMFMFNYKHDSYLAIHMKQSCKTKVIGDIVDDIFSNSKMIKPSDEYFSYYNIGDVFYYFMDAFNFVNNINEIKNNSSNEEWDNYCRKYPQIINIYKTINENDNPIMIKFRVKKF